MYYIINAKGEICGESLDAFTPADGLRLIAKDDYHPNPQAALAAAKTAEATARTSPTRRWETPKCPRETASSSTGNNNIIKTIISATSSSTAFVTIFD